MVYTLRFFSSKCSLFHNSNVFDSCIIHILYTGVLKLKKIIPAKRLKTLFGRNYNYFQTGRLMICLNYAIFRASTQRAWGKLGRSLIALQNPAFRNSAYGAQTYDSTAKC